MAGMIILSRQFLTLALLSLGALFTVTACDLTEASALTDSRAQVREDRFSDSFNLGRVDAAYIDSIADRYTRNGDGPLRLTVAYDPQSKTNTAMTASQALASLSGQLKRAGVNTIEGGIVPVRGGGDEARVLVTFDSYSAAAPDCAVMSGMESRDLNVDEDYKLGCTTETVIARQIARPKDLKGNGSTDILTDGRRSSNTIEGYRTGTPNEKLGGESSSE